MLHKACKKAKTFELQKLTRKIKTTRSVLLLSLSLSPSRLIQGFPLLSRLLSIIREPKDNKPVDEAVLKDLESQLIALKVKFHFSPSTTHSTHSPFSLSLFSVRVCVSLIQALSIDPVPFHILSTRLPKLPCLRSTNFLPSLISSIPTNKNLNWKELDGQSPEGKVRNRILANKTLTSEGWEEVVRAIRKRMGETVEPTTTITANTSTNTKATITMKSDDKGKGKETIDEAEKEKEKEERGGEKRLSKRAERARKAEETKKNLPKRTMEMSAERKAALEALERGGRMYSEDEHDEKDDDDDDEGPIAGSENELDDDEIERELAAMNEGLSGSEGDWSGSEDENEDGFESDSSLPQQPRLKRTRLSSASSPPPPPPTTKKSKIREIPTHKPVTSSAFLPSLASGYVSYSDSDGEDAKWVKAAEKESRKGERKNRRGQRARQA